jgi:Spy/CpxP family protein refolding chaperone
MSAWKAVCAVLVVFILGTAFGLAISLWIAPRTGVYPPLVREVTAQRMNRWLARNLSLNPEQRKAMTEIIEDARKQLADVRKETRPHVRQIILNARERMRAQLNLDQQARFDEIVKRNRLLMDSGQ